MKLKLFEIRPNKSQIFSIQIFIIYCKYLRDTLNKIVKYQSYIYFRINARIELEILRCNRKQTKF